MSAPAPIYKSGVAKMVLSGDTVIIRGQPQGGPPPEKTLSLSGITAPKLARQKTVNNNTETKDEPFGWEAREFLRKKLVGKSIIFTSEKPPNATREYGSIWIGKDPTKDENVIESLLAEGLVKVRESSRNFPPMKKLVEIEDAARAQGKGLWGTDIQKHIRDIKWTIDNPKQFVNKHNGQPIKAVMEYVRDGSTVRLTLLPDYYTITLMMSGIRCPAIKQDGESEPYAEEARYFVESKLLQQDVEVILESVNNAYFVGTILHPGGNIAEALLKQGFAKCVDWSLAVMKSGAATLRAAEKVAKEAKLRIWTKYISNAPIISPKDKEFTGVVLEIMNGDALMIKLSNGTTKKIFLASIRPPREKNNGQDEEAKQSPRPKGFKPLYEIPWMYEAREFLRKKLIGKKVSVTVDYIQPAKDTYPAKTCCTVMAGATNIAEALVSKGYATVVRYRNDNDQRSSHYDKLLESELKAQKAAIGLHAKKDIPTHRIQDTSGDPAKARKFLPFLKRIQKTEAVVEFVASGSRLRLYIPKESVLVTFLLAGVVCPRGARPSASGGPMQLAEPHGEEALQFTKEKCLQRDVYVTIEDMDKAGSFIGWLWIENENMSVSLVEHGLATMHHAAESSEYARAIKTAEETAKMKRIGLWRDFIEVDQEIEKEHNTPIVERIVNYDKVIVTVVKPDGNFYVQNIDLIPKLEALMERMHHDFKNCSSPMPGSFVPRKGYMCAARFTADDNWYRAKIEKVTEDGYAHIFYIDYGNREILDFTRLAPMPPNMDIEPPYVSEYVLSCIKLPSDADELREAMRAFCADTLNKKLLLNIESRGTPPAVTLVDASTKCDIGKNLIREGLVLMDYTREPRLASLMGEYRAAQEHAKKSRLKLWRHGNIVEDDAVEFEAHR
ncbi:PREDICTED: staphylococcal nuclease domain-containing protein 1 [Papilio polytes]|uniref:staphylococcal nuclease domain-containing protein 1 n=1 Tax=Papilio polytes TaxID=76194 RepID=UPI000675DF4C|nr:PREDICTED: staphylococcal nuclease domain-containing protein 1 [Papilio polytes]